MRTRGYQQAPRVHEPKGLRMRGYQQAPRVHEPKDEDARIPTSTQST